MLQIQHRVAGGGLGLISRRRVDKDAPPGIRRLGQVILDQHIAVRHIFPVVIPLCRRNRGPEEQGRESMRPAAPRLELMPVLADSRNPGSPLQRAGADCPHIALKAPERLRATPKDAWSEDQS